MTHTFRLHPNDDLKVEIEKFVKSHNIEAAAILTCVGSLSQAVIRLADKLEIRKFNKTFEIVSLVGTVSINGSHMHISLSDDQGLVIGGHLKEGCVIHTTAEIVIYEMLKVVFMREMDKQSGFNELIVKDK
jgi:predicted DNA-binding protein with PD1-like motif